MNESQGRKELTEKKRRKIWSLLSKLVGIGLWVALIIACIVNREKISAEGIVGFSEPKRSVYIILGKKRRLLAGRPRVCILAQVN